MQCVIPAAIYKIVVENAVTFNAARRLVGFYISNMRHHEHVTEARPRFILVGIQETDCLFHP